jgi:hypothetical protein
VVDASGNHAGNGQKPIPEDEVEHPYHQSRQTGGFLLLKTLPHKNNARSTLEFSFYLQNGRRVYRVVKKAKPVGNDQFI